MRSFITLGLTAFLTFSGIASAQNGAPAPQRTGLSGLRASVLIDTLTRYYPTPLIRDGQYDQELDIDNIHCTLATSSAAEPSCSVTRAGKVVSAPDLRSLSPSATVYQLLNETNAAHPAQDNANLIVAEISDLGCVFGGHGAPEANCSLQQMYGNDIPNTPVTLTATGILAKSATAALAQAGVPDQARQQYQTIFAADSITCTQTIREFARDSQLACAVKVGEQTYTPDSASSTSLYRLIAESGGSNYYGLNNAYVATATGVRCANLYTHGDTPYSCTFSLASRHPVLTRRISIIVPNDQLAAFYQALLANHASLDYDDGIGRSYSLSSLDCVNPSVTSDQVSALSCNLTAAGKPVAAGTPSELSVLAQAVVAGQAARLDPATLSTSLISTGTISCYASHGAAENCSIMADAVFPL